MGLTPYRSGNNTPRQGSFYSEKDPTRKSTTSDVVVRGALDEKNAVYSKAVALEEAEDEDSDDLEKALPPRPEGRVHAIKVSVAIMLVIVSQCLGVSKVWKTLILWMLFLLTVSDPE